MRIREINESIRKFMESYNDFSFSGSVDGYSCDITIEYRDGLYYCTDTMVDFQGEGFNTPLKAFNDFKFKISSFLADSEENIDNEAYSTDFEFDDDIEEKLDKFGYECYKLDLDESMNEDDLSKKAKKLIDTLNKKRANWNERSMFNVLGVKNLSNSDLDMIQMYAERIGTYGNYDGFMKPMGGEAEVLRKAGLIESIPDLTLAGETKIKKNQYKKTRAKKVKVDDNEDLPSSLKLKEDKINELSDELKDKVVDLRRQRALDAMDKYAKSVSLRNKSNSNKPSAEPVTEPVGKSGNTSSNTVRNGSAGDYKGGSYNGGTYTSSHSDSSSNSSSHSGSIYNFDSHGVDDSDVEEDYVNYEYSPVKEVPVETPILPATQKDVEGIIEQAIKREKQLEIEYMASDFKDNEITDRKIFPIKIYTGDELNVEHPLTKGKWGARSKYLKAFCLLRKEERYFKLSRIRKITLEDKTLVR